MEHEVKTVEAEVEEGRQREDILNSFKGVGVSTKYRLSEMKQMMTTYPAQ